MHCIIHTHTTATMAVSSVEGGLQPTNFYACNFIGQIAYHDFEGVTVRAEEGERLVEAIGGKRVLMLRNHGPVVMGRTLPEAFITYWSLQRACEIQLATMSMGKPIAGVAGRHQCAPARSEPGAVADGRRRSRLCRDGAQGRQDRSQLARLMACRGDGDARPPGYALMA